MSTHREDSKAAAGEGPESSGAERLNSVWQMQVSPEYEAFLADELDSDGYARALVRHRLEDPARNQRGLEGHARALEEAIKDPTEPVIARTAITAPEYRRFLRAEISSRRYAESVARYAHLEELFTSPSRAPSRSTSSRSGALALWFIGLVGSGTASSMRLGFSIVGIAGVVALLLPQLVTRFLGLAHIDAQGAWAVGFLGVSLLLVTLLAGASSLVFAKHGSIRQSWSEHP